ncbi:MAG: 23S rRNA (adenine(2503)-C(2))-methyltransferase RlmN [Desulfobulbaceae bacterium]|nr:23S rRNA (adenine(2503)-C(2))-methyltransferase RlmN [Desulfobulbaceae bacterium]
MKRPDLTNLTRHQLSEFLSGLGLPSSRSSQVFAALQRPGICNFSQMVDVKRDLRLLLAEHADICRLSLDKVEQSRDGTIKYAFRLSDGNLIESVLIPAEGERHTLCVSSQVGCAMGCKFCLTGTMGFTRNLQASEIVNQVFGVIAHMIDGGVRRTTVREYINNLVFMGMGEPLANYENLSCALDILMDEKGLEFTERRITVSTCGIVPKIKKMATDLRVNLAISLHAADDKTRSGLMPVNTAYPLENLLAVCRDYPLAKKKVILIEYILLKGINDRESDALQLAEKLTGLSCRINLLPYNESESLPYRCPEEEDIAGFQSILRQAGFRTFIRSSRGADISAACGQLAGKG